MQHVHSSQQLWNQLCTDITIQCLDCDLLRILIQMFYTFELVCRDLNWSRTTEESSQVTLSRHTNRNLDIATPQAGPLLVSSEFEPTSRQKP
ncbi:hypothetical protein TNCV_4278381 [Trichonephila clavipes]|nr:hypothetical protein TNCV_4278381 [Trichonephila clavipes]